MRGQDVTIFLSRVRMKGTMAAYTNSTLMMLYDLCVCVESCVDILSLTLIGFTQIRISIE